MRPVARPWARDLFGRAISLAAKMQMPGFSAGHRLIVET